MAAKADRFPTHLNFILFMGTYATKIYLFESHTNLP